MASAGHNSAVPPPIPTKWFVSPDTLYYGVASRAKTTPRPESPMRSLGPFQSQVGARVGMWRTKGVVGYLDQPWQLSAIALCRSWRFLRSWATAEPRGTQPRIRVAA